MPTKAGAAHCPALEFVASASEKMPPELFERFHEGHRRRAVRTRSAVPKSPMNGSPTGKRSSGAAASASRCSAARCASSARTGGMSIDAGRSRRGLDQEPDRMLLLLAQIRQVARDLHRRMDPHRRSPAIRRRRLLLVQRPRLTTCSRSRDFGCRRSKSKRRSPATPQFARPQLCRSKTPTD